MVFLRLAFSCFPGGQVAKLFQDSSLGNAVNIVVTRLILLMEDQVKSTKLSLLLLQSAVTKLQELPDCVRFVAPSLSHSENPLGGEEKYESCKNREEWWSKKRKLGRN